MQVRECNEILTGFSFSLISGTEIVMLASGGGGRKPLAAAGGTVWLSKLSCPHNHPNFPDILYPAHGSETTQKEEMPSKSS